MIVKVVMARDKNTNSHWLVYLFLLISFKSSVAQVSNLIPHNTATHTAIQDGQWFDPDTWDTGTIPDDAAIVVIPQGIHIEYQGCSDAHIFAIRVDGQFTCLPESGADMSCLRFDTFVSGHMSLVRILANNPTDQINITIDPFDISSHKNGQSGFAQEWNQDAMSHYSDGEPVYSVVREVQGDRRYNTLDEALDGDTEVVEISRALYDDGPGVTGRYLWDPLQHSLGFIGMGQIEIIGAPKEGKVKLKNDALENDNELLIENTPQGWLANDEIIISRDGLFDNGTQADDFATIQDIDGNSIILNENLDYNHQGVIEDSLHCYVGNLTRNITFRSAQKDQIHQRGHVMAMHHNENLQIRNAAFIDLGRTDKSRVTDDFIWDTWIAPKVFKSKISPLGQEVCRMKMLPIEEITNTRGRYSIHLHKTGATLTDNIVNVTGNVVWGNPGWGITHHDSYANVSDNVVVDVTGAGIVSESGSELGFWDNNLVIDVKSGHNMSPYDAAVFHDDLLYSGQGLGMKGRGVLCRDNVVIGTEQGVGVLNLNPSISNHDRVDPLALASVRPDFLFDQFPLSHNGYSKEGDGVMPVEVPLIMENTVVIDAQQGLRSIERDMGLNHESRSIFDGYIVWGAKHGLSINYQADYSFKDVYISGNGKDNTIGMFMWKHSHNQTFENIKLVDLDYGIQVSRLVESGNGELKTRNNGFTPWIFVDLELEDVNNLYFIEKEDPETIAEYTEHSDNTIIIDSESITARPITFTILDENFLVVDYLENNFRFEVDGIITDDFGSYKMGTEQALAQGTLRLDYPSRIYEFASVEKFEEYLIEHGVFQDPETEAFFFIIDEWLPNRRTFEYEKFEVKVRINNAPNSPLYADAFPMDATQITGMSQLISRFSVASQSSTAEDVSFDGVDIDASAWKAIDGNNNGRINCQIHQRDLVPIGSFSQTKIETEPWFELDLQDQFEIEFIDIWNTVELNGSEEETLSDHSNGFYLLVSDTPFGDIGLSDARNLADYEYYSDEILRKYSFNDLIVEGRYIRIQAVGDNKIQLAEVEIIGKVADQVNSTTSNINPSAKIYPIPSDGRFSIEAETIIDEIQVYDLLGRLLNKISDIKSNQRSFSLDLPTGTYLLKISTESGKTVSQKIVIL